MAAEIDIVSLPLSLLIDGYGSGDRHRLSLSLSINRLGMASIIALKDGVFAPAGSNDLYSSAKEKAAKRGAYHSCLYCGGSRVPSAVLRSSSSLPSASPSHSLMGWNPNPSSSVSSPSSNL